MFNFIKKLFKKDVDTSNFMFINDEDVKNKIVIDKMYNKQFIINKMQEVIDKYNITKETLDASFDNFALVFYKAIKNIEEEIETEYLKEKGYKDWELYKLTEAERNFFAKYFTFLQKHFFKLMMEMLDGNYKDQNKDYIYDINELAEIPDVVEAKFRLYFNDYFEKLLEYNKQTLKQKHKNTLKM